MYTVASADGTRIAYDRLGEGPAVILVNGAMGYRRFKKFDQIATSLSEHCTVINYDRRGRGDSGDSASYAAEREIDDLAAVIGYAGGPAGVFGHSSGAVLALEAAARGLARVSGVS